MGNALTDSGAVVWQPTNSRVESSNMYEFLQTVKKKHENILDWDSLYNWSISEQNEFWGELAEFVKIKWSKLPEGPSYKPGSNMRDGKWFEGGALNFAENLLLEPNSELAVISHFEGQRKISWNRKELFEEVRKLRNALVSEGVTKGDRVCGVLVNGPHAIAAMLATASLGAIWSSSSPDFGYSGICDRFKQISPKVMFFTKSYKYSGKTFDCVDTAKKVTDSIASISKTVMVDHLSDGEAYSDKLISYDEFSGLGSVGSLAFEPCSFSDPLFIMFSSGTTGVPKCIIHSVGGTLLQHKKELALHTDIKPSDRMFYFTTCGWMMWNWMVSTLSVGGCVVTYDGAVNTPDMGTLWKIVSEEKVKVFGTSPKFLSVCMKEGYSPSRNLGFDNLKTILSTGSPLLPEHYEYVYGEFPEDMQLASISGGTDIISCFMLGNPLLPVRAGEIQSRGLGMAVEAWKNPMEAVVSEKAELVCVRPFASMPTSFWGDSGDEKYRKAYFSYYTEKDLIDSEFKEVWRHGDFIEISSNGGVIVYGRSDATLNPGGVRIGTAEIYRTVEANERVLDSIVVGQPKNGDVDVLLFVKLQNSFVSELEKKPDAWAGFVKQLKTDIRKELTPRHVPYEIFRVGDIPYTRSGKKVELAVLGALRGEKASNESALSNPEALEEYLEIGKQI